MKKLFSLIFILGLTFLINPSVISQDLFQTDDQITSIKPFGLNSEQNINKNQSDNPRTAFVVLPNNGFFSSGGARLPQGGKRFIRTLYLVKATEIDSSGFGTGLVTCVGWGYYAQAPYFQNIATTGNVKIYLQNTSDVVMTKTNNFPIEIVSMTLVSNGTVSLPAGAGPFNIDVPVGGTGTLPFSRTAGMGVYVAIDYETILPLATPIEAPTPYVRANSGGPVMARYYSSQTVNSDIMNFTSTTRPETRFCNAAVDIIAVNNIYALGKVPTPWGCPDTICYRIKRVIPNPLPIQIRIRVINRNPFPGNIKFDSTFLFDPGNPLPFDTVLAFNRPWNYPGWKKDSIIVEVQPLPGEDVTDNNRLSYRSMITCDAWNWAEDDVEPDGGVGFTNGRGNFVACFKNNCPTQLPLWAVDLCFYSTLGGGNQPYQVKVFLDGGGQPGPILYSSPTYLSPPGTATPPQRLQRPLPNIMIPPFSKFYVGITQLDTINIAYCYQNEDPVKRGRFFYSTEIVGVGPWTDFGVAGVPFRLDICPRTVSRVNLSAYLQGFYNGTIMVADTARLQAREATSPYALVDVATNHLQPNGMGWFEFCRVECNRPYYFVIRHRNHIQTWTANPLVYDCELPYNFTTSITQAYGNNMIFVTGDSPKEGVGGGFATYTSDVNQDDVVDGADCADIDNDAASFVTGYVVTDVNGDEVVDGVDLSYCDNNSSNFVAAITP